jgi:hypothetical protein
MSEEIAQAPVIDRAPSPAEERASKRQKVDEAAPAEKTYNANGMDKLDRAEEKQQQNGREDNRNKGLAPIKKEYVDEISSKANFS